MIVLIVDGDYFEIVSFEYLIAFHATEVIDALAPGQDLSSFVLARLHTINNLFPYFRHASGDVNPPVGVCRVIGDFTGSY